MRGRRHALRCVSHSDRRATCWPAGLVRISEVGQARPWRAIAQIVALSGGIRGEGTQLRRGRRDTELRRAAIPGRGHHWIGPQADDLHLAQESGIIGPAERHGRTPASGVGGSLVEPPRG